MGNALAQDNRIQSEFSLQVYPQDSRFSNWYTLKPCHSIPDWLPEHVCNIASK